MSELWTMCSCWEMIMKNNKIRKFKLVDKEGYLSADESNESIYYDKLKEDLFEGYINESGYLTNSMSGVLITPTEFKFFEEVFNKGDGEAMSSVKGVKIDSAHRHCKGTGSNTITQVDLEFDYDLIEKIGTTHYHKDSKALYKMDGACYYCYGYGGEWFKSFNDIEYLKENLLPIPKRFSAQVGDICEIQTLKGDFNCKILGFYKDSNAIEFVWVEKLKPSEYEDPFKTYQLSTVKFKPTKPKTWQEVLCEDFDIYYNKNEDSLKFSRGYSSEGIINLAKRIIELSGE